MTARRSVRRRWRSRADDPRTIAVHFRPERAFPRDLIPSSDRVLDDGLKLVFVRVSPRLGGQRHRRSLSAGGRSALRTRENAVPIAIGVLEVLPVPLTKTEDVAYFMRDRIIRVAARQDYDIRPGLVPVARATLVECWRSGHPARNETVPAVVNYGDDIAAAGSGSMMDRQMGPAAARIDSADAKVRFQLFEVHRQASGARQNTPPADCGGSPQPQELGGA